MYEKKVAEVEKIVRRQNQWRLKQTINLIASENVLSRRARALLDSDFNHRYAEGHPGSRYYEGTEYIDVIESEVREVMKQLFGCRRAEVRCISGTVANESVFGALLQENDLVFVNQVQAGGHISHQKFGAVGKFTHNIKEFPTTPDGYRMDVAKVKDMIHSEKPKMVVLGKSLILHPEPVQELAPVCRETKTILVYDGAHVLGLIAGKQFQDPLAEGADVLLGSTHKTFFGSQRGVVLSNTPDDDFWKKIDRAAFPGSVSNHHLFTLPPLLVAAYEMLEFGRAYAKQVVANARALANALARRGVEVAGREFGYTHTHQVAVNVARYGGGPKAAKVLLKNDIIVNFNLLPFDKKRSEPSGLRLGVQEMTRFGMKEEEMEHLASLMQAALEGRDVRSEVHRLRDRFQAVQYSFDDVAAPVSADA